MEKSPSVEDVTRKPNRKNSLNTKPILINYNLLSNTPTTPPETTTPSMKKRCLLMPTIIVVPILQSFHASTNQQFSNSTSIISTVSPKVWPLIMLSKNWVTHYPSLSPDLLFSALAPTFNIGLEITMLLGLICTCPSLKSLISICSPFHSSVLIFVGLLEKLLLNSVPVGCSLVPSTPSQEIITLKAPNPKNPTLSPITLTCSAVLVNHCNSDIRF
jgi:hypothetical protein